MKTLATTTLSLALVCCLLFALWRKTASEKEYLHHNQTVLLDTLSVYKVRDSLNAISSGVLSLKISELERYRASDIRLIRDMGLRLRRVKSVGSVGSMGSYEFVLKRDSTPLWGARWHYKDRWVEFQASQNGDSLHSKIKVYDTITQILHRVPRFKFLGIWFGTKGVRQEIVSKNPHTTIVYAQYIEIRR